MRARGRAAAAMVALLLAWSPGRAEAWGFRAHRLVNRKAVAALPPPLRELFEPNADYVAEHAVDPDLWRESRRTEEPNHYLDLDAFGPYPFDAVARDEATHLARHGAAAAKEGRVPWRAGEVYRDLVDAFRAHDAARVLERAAVLGHYVGDAHVPLHAVVNYDGQLTGQIGLHARWEDELIERFDRQLEPEVRPSPARPARDPVGLVFDVLLASFREAEGVLASDRDAVSGRRDLVETPEDDRYDAGYYSRLFEIERARLVSRLTASSEALAALWLGAWEEAGRPDLGGFRVPYVRRGARMVLLSLDGASAPVVDEAIARGAMPHLARLRAAGATARGVVPALPVKTAVAHASLFTGAWADRHGVVGNDFPTPGGALTSSASGYESTHLRAEPLWIAAARQGLRATVATATQAFPFTPYLEEKRFGANYGQRLTLIEGYRNCAAEDVVYTERDLDPRPAEGWGAPPPAGAKEIEIAFAGLRVHGLLFDDPEDPTAGFDRLRLTVDKAQGGILLAPEPPRGTDASAFAGLPVRVPKGDAVAQFRLFELSPDGTRLVLYRTHVHTVAASRPNVGAAACAAAGGFAADGAFWAYETGAFGPPLWAGGDGSAERRYLETVALVARQITLVTDLALDRTAWDLLVTYLPVADEVLHAWLGRLDPHVPGHDPAVASRLRPHLDEALRLADGFVGRLAERVGPETILAVTADHGQIAAHAVVRPNVALARAGLLAVDDAGRIDLGRTRALASPGSPWSVFVNRAALPGGIVPPGEEAAVLRRAEKALRTLVDPATRRPAIADVVDLRSRGGPLGLDARTGDLFVLVPPGYDLSGDCTGAPVEPTRPKGIHIQHRDEPGMRAVLALAGPGVATGVDLGIVEQIDVAPTLCALLGIDPPAQSVGRVLEKALARRSTP